MTQAVVFFDLDKTLLTPDKNVPEGNRRAIAQLKANGHIPVLCTGKNFYETDHIRQQSGIEAVVAANGADIYNDGVQIATEPLDPAIVARFSAAAAKDNFPVAYYNGKRVAVSNHNEHTRADYQMMAQALPPIRQDFAETEPVTMMLLFDPERPDLSEPIKAKYEAAFPELTFYRNGPYALDVVANSVNKGTGVKLLLKTMGLGDAPTYAFGDGNNDIAMFEAVKTGIAMGNALPALLPYAAWQTTDYMADGIAVGLAHFGLI